MNRINKLFEDKKENILSVFFTAGYPKLNDTMSILEAAEKKGINMVELGFPFSDPIADGPTIQNSSNIALKNGMNIKKLFSQIKDMRETVSMGYVNIVMQYGLENFCKSCKRCGIDGVILPDLPMKDYLSKYKPMLDKYEIVLVLLITPETTDKRVREIDTNTNSFIYMVSSASTTGTQTSFDKKKQDYFAKINNMGLKNPRLVGFGISNKQTLEAAFKNSSGAIIGSKFVKCLECTSNPEKAFDMLLDSFKR